MPGPLAAHLDQARRLKFSPAWGDQAVVFDARSGDFWIVASEIRDTLAAACSDPTDAAGWLRHLLPDDVDELVAHGIIGASNSR